MSNNTSRRLTASQFAFYLAFASLACFVLVTFRLLPFEPGWSARVTNSLMDTAFAGTVLLLGSLTSGFIAWRKARLARQVQAEKSLLLAQLDKLAAVESTH